MKHFKRLLYGYILILVASVVAILGIYASLHISTILLASIIIDFFVSVIAYVIGYIMIDEHDDHEECYDCEDPYDCDDGEDEDYYESDI